METPLYQRKNSSLALFASDVSRWCPHSILTFVLLLWGSFATAQSQYHKSLADSAYTLTRDRVIYDPTYYVIPYPNGDVPKGKGVCTDVIIRAYRKLGFDLQREVHRDMKANFSAYPKKWGLKSADKNIDHRRVLNLMTFFERRNASLAITTLATDYKPGDIVCWMLPGNLTHIGIVVHKKSTDGKRHLIVHNIGSGQVMEDCLFAYEIIGHYRFEPK